MKYENKEQADALCEKIRKSERLLDDLNRDILVMMKVPYANNVFESIDTRETSEHPFKERAVEFVDCLKSQVKSEIADLKNKLDEL